MFKMSTVHFLLLPAVPNQLFHISTRNEPEERHLYRTAVAYLTKLNYILHYCAILAYFYSISPV